MNRVDEIEYMVACNELTAAQVFTQMRQLIPNKNIEAERDAMNSKYLFATREALIQKLEKLEKLEAVNYGNLYNLCRANYHLKECLEILRENNWRGDLQEQIIEQLEGEG